MEINKRKIMGITILSMNNASIYLDEKFKSAKPDDPKYDSSLVISASVLRAITCELCIKAILDNQGLNIKENKYQKYLLKLIKDKNVQLKIFRKEIYYYGSNNGIRK